MRKPLQLLSGIMIAATFFIGCNDKTTITALNAVSLGTADFTRFVTIGNSLTQGEQSGSVYQSAQNYSIGALLAKQVNTTFEQAIFPDPGCGGRIEISSLSPFALKTNTIVNPPNNLTYPAPYNNLGVRFAFLYDVIHTTATANSYTATNFNFPNPMFDVILRGSGSQFSQAKAQHPTFISLWIGCNDILTYATRGGLFPPTSPANYQVWYGQVLDSLQSTNANVLVTNIPNITALPYFRTIGPKVAAAIDPVVAAKKAVGLYYQKTTDTSGVPQTQFVTPAQLVNGTIYLILSGSSAAGLIGDVTGKYYIDNNIPVPKGVVTAAPFGLHFANPFPGKFVLDSSEIATTTQIINGYNQIIAGLAAAKSMPVVDINKKFDSLATYGTVVDGLTFTTQYIAGGIFSLDGVHPTSRGYAIITNEFIKVINEKFGASIPAVNMADIPPMELTPTLAKRRMNTKNQLDFDDLPVFEPGTFDNVSF